MGISRIILLSVFAFSMAPKAEGGYTKIGMLPDGKGGHPYIEISFDDKRKVRNKMPICETSILITLPSNSDSYTYPCPADKTERTVVNDDVLIVDDKIYSDTKDQLVQMIKAPCQREFYNPRRSELLSVEECNLIKSAMERKTSVKTLKAEENDRLQKEREAEAERVRKEREAEAERLRMEAEAERLRKEAEAERLRKEREAEAERLRREAETERLRKEAEAERLRKEMEAEAERLRMEAEAERLRMEAEAERLRKEKQEELDRIKKEKGEEILKLQRDKDAAQARLEKEQADAQEKLKQSQLEQERLQNTLKEQERLRQEKKEAKERKRQEENLARQKEKEAQAMKSRGIDSEDDKNKKTKASTNLSRILSNILGFSTSGLLKIN